MVCVCVCFQVVASRTSLVRISLNLIVFAVKEREKRDTYDLVFIAIRFLNELTQKSKGVTPANKILVESTLRTLYGPLLMVQAVESYVGPKPEL